MTRPGVCLLIGRSTRRELPLVCYTSGADVTEYRATLMTHHLRARSWTHPGAEARRRHVCLIESLGIT